MTFTSTARISIFALSLWGISLMAASSNIVTQTYSGGFPATISGTLPNQGTALEETITLSSTTNLTAYTTSYASGGFEPTLTLFNAAGNYLASSGANGSGPNAKADPTTGQALDAYLTDNNLAAGQYIVTLTDFELNQALTATNLSAGFTNNYGNGINFVDEDLNTRNGNYALTIQATATPEPASWLLVLPGIFIFGCIGRKRMQLRSTQHQNS